MRAQPLHLSRRSDGARARRGITLIEILIVVTLLGIAGTLVIPAMGQVNVLRIQTSLRTVVADLTFAQSDAMASQARRVIIFGKVAQLDPGTGVWNIVDGNGYTVFAPPPGAASVTMSSDAMPDPSKNGLIPLSRDFDDTEFGGVTIQNVGFNGADALIFDELGGPVESLTGDNPGSGGSLQIAGPNATYQINVEPFTGRITVVRLAAVTP